MQQDKNARKECSEGENYQGDSWQENYLDGQTNGMTKNIEEDWREIRDGRKENGRGKKEQKQLQRKKKLRKKNQKLENEQKMMITKQATQLTHTMNCRKIPWDKET